MSEGGREGEWVGKLSEGGRERGREGEREGGREGGREGECGVETDSPPNTQVLCPTYADRLHQHP